MSSSGCISNVSTQRFEPQYGPLQLHHVLPTLQPSDGYYRTAATSPFQQTQNSEQRTNISLTRPTIQAPDLQLQGMTVLPISSPMNDDTQRRYNDDYDSDDELRREDISFSIDGGE